MEQELRNAIRACGKSLTQLEREAGLPSGCLSRFLSGSDVSLGTASKIAAHLGLRLMRPSAIQVKHNRGADIGVDFMVVETNQMASIRAEIDRLAQALRQAQENLGSLRRLTCSDDATPRGRRPAKREKKET